MSQTFRCHRRNSLSSVYMYLRFPSWMLKLSLKFHWYSYIVHVHIHVYVCMMFHVFILLTHALDSLLSKAPPPTALFPLATGQLTWRLMERNMFETLGLKYFPSLRFPPVLHMHVETILTMYSTYIHHLGITQLQKIRMLLLPTCLVDFRYMTLYNYH